MINKLTKDALEALVSGLPKLEAELPTNVIIYTSVTFTDTVDKESIEAALKTVNRTLNNVYVNTVKPNGTTSFDSLAEEYDAAVEHAALELDTAKDYNDDTLVILALTTESDIEYPMWKPLTEHLAKTISKSKCRIPVVIGGIENDSN